MQQRFGKHPSPSVMRRVLMAGAAAPDAFTDPAGIQKRAQRFGMLHRPWALDLSVGVRYRAGDFAGVIQRVGFANRGIDGATGPWEWLFLAIAHHRLKHTGEAKKWLDQAATWIAAAEKQQDGPLGSTRPGWYNWRERVMANALRREAESLIKGK
jgi:hypothetical protein